jgi:hypothetical protein
MRSPVLNTATERTPIPSLLAKARFDHPSNLRASLHSAGVIISPSPALSISTKLKSLRALAHSLRAPTSAPRVDVSPGRILSQLSVSSGVAVARRGARLRLSESIARK